MSANTFIWFACCIVTQLFIHLICLFVAESLTFKWRTMSTFTKFASNWYIDSFWVPFCPSIENLFHRCRRSWPPKNLFPKKLLFQVGCRVFVSRRSQSWKQIWPKLFHCCASCEIFSRQHLCAIFYPDEVHEAHYRWLRYLQGLKNTQNILISNKMLLSHFAILSMLHCFSSSQLEVCCESKGFRYIYFG